MTIRDMWRGNSEPPGGSDGFAQKALIGLLTIIWAGLLAFVVRLDGKASDNSTKLTEMNAGIVQIQADLRSITEARSAEALEARTRNTRRIEQLEGVERVERAKEQ